MITYKKYLSITLLSFTLYTSYAQAPKGISMDEYEKAKTFVIKDLDNESYVKFENNYVLDRYEGKKPYFITGDDGKKKRIDIYTLTSKADGKTLGTMIYYTNEAGKQYIACLPNNAAEGKVWEKYFEDIHAIDKQEQNFVLKLSYVLSKEYSYQEYKSSLGGKAIDRSEAGTYGNDICFTGDDEVTMANGTKKLLIYVKPGDQVVTVDPVTHQSSIVNVKGLIEHEAKNYAITHLTLISAKEKVVNGSYEIELSAQELKATPNHPMMTKTGIKEIGKLNELEEVMCLNEKTGKMENFIVWDKKEKAGGKQKVYNIDAAGGSTFIINGVMVMQKQQ